MKKTMFFVLLLVAVVAHEALANMNLSSTLYKAIPSIEYPNNERNVRLEVVTKVDYQSGNRKSDDFDQARKIHEILVQEYAKAGWKEDDLAMSDIDGGKVDLVIEEGMNLRFENTLRIKAFVYQCGDFPMQKYRGGDVRAFFSKDVVKKSEECITQNNGLQWPGWPY
ncbi:MAG: hypothetical protein J0665_14515 [Deltaproteobacteria bacterium]|nr:hypothetical protein [Deltaproteobacteria bacterium]